MRLSELDIADGRADWKILRESCRKRDGPGDVL